MIPPDVANSLRLLLPDRQAPTDLQTQPVAPSPRLADVLSDLVPGQRIMAEIQAMLPNGTYRATIAQRDITLALPFSAKPGDSLELEVTESNGQRTLAVVTPPPGAGQALEQTQGAVATTLSQTGRLIGDLLGEIDHQGRRAPPAPLNAAQPLVETMPKDAGDLAPVLKQALAQSGMFYEAHQARWVSGEFPIARLLREPQGQLSQPRAIPAGVPGMGNPLPAPATAATTTATTTAAAATMPPPAAPATGISAPPAAEIAPLLAEQPTPSPPVAEQASPKETAMPPSAGGSGETDAAGVERGKPVAVRLPEAKGIETQAAPPPHMASGMSIPAALTPLVQQQLDALATQIFTWQGQIWPGQQMQWEIEQQANERNERGDDDIANTWRTRLKLDLPRLGEISANLSLQPGGEVKIELAAESPASEARLDGAAAQLLEQMTAAGLKLTLFSVKHGEAAE